MNIEFLEFLEFCSWKAVLKRRAETNDIIGKEVTLVCVKGKVAFSRLSLTPPDVVSSRQVRRANRRREDG